MRSLLLFFLPFLAFAQEATHQMIPEDCPFFSGLSQNKDEMKFEMKFIGLCGAKISPMKVFNVHLHAPDHKLYLYRGFYMNGNLMLTQMLRNQSKETFTKVSPGVFKKEMRTHGECLDGEHFIHKINDLKNKKERTFIFVPYSSTEMSKVDNAYMYICADKPFGEKYYLIGENFKPNESIEIANKHHENSSESGVIKIFANSNGRFFHQMSLTDPKVTGGKNHVTLKREKESIVLEHFWGEKYLLQENRMGRAPKGNEEECDSKHLFN